MKRGRSRVGRGMSDQATLGIAVAIGVVAAIGVIAYRRGTPAPGSGAEAQKTAQTETGATGTASEDRPRQSGGASPKPVVDHRKDFVARVDAFILADRERWRRSFSNARPRWSERSEAERAGLLMDRKRYEAMLRRNLLKTIELWPLPLNGAQQAVLARVWAITARLTLAGTDVALSHLKTCADAEMTAYKADPAGYRAALETRQR